MIVFVLWVDLCHRISEAGVDRRQDLADQALPVARGLTNKAPTWLSSFETSIKFKICAELCMMTSGTCPHVGQSFAGVTLSYHLRICRSQPWSAIQGLQTVVL